MHLALRNRLIVTVASLLAAVVTVGSSEGALADTTGNWYYQQRALNGGVGSYAQFGSSTDTVLIGDWNGDGRDTLMIRRGNEFYVTNSPTGGATAYSFRYGSGGDVVVVGDWNGDGKDTLGVRRGNQYFLTDAPRGGTATHVFRYGSGGDVLIVGDWNGDRRDTFGVRRGNSYYLTNREGGQAETVAKFGSGGDVVLVGDWNGDNRDSLGVRRGNKYFLANSVTGGRTDVVNTFGSPDDTSYVGDWNGDGVDTISVRRLSGPPRPPRTYSGNASYVVGSQFEPGLYRGSAARGAGCYWERTSDFSGDGIIANDFEIGPVTPLYVQVKSEDKLFNTQDCGTWTEARPSDAARYVTLDDGEYRVGKDMAAGLYQAPGGDSCYWETSTSFDHEFESLIDNSFGETRPVVDTRAAFGFSSSDCGTWTRLPDAARSTRTKGVPDRKAFVDHRKSTLRSRN